MKHTTVCYIERDDCYLMIHRTKKENDVNHDKWIGIGGKLEPGESPHECIVREVLEETGLTIQPRYRGFITFVSNEFGTEYMHLFTADSFVGEITDVNVEPVLDLLEKGYIPVVSTVGFDEENNTYNINADTVAARLAGELKAESLISMTDIVGLLQDKDDPSTLIPKVYVSDAPKLIRDGVISGGMIPKVNCCIEAIRRGVHKVFIIDGRIPHSLLIEILTDEGLGTMFVQS